MSRRTIVAFFRSFTWKEWTAFVVITALHVWPGLRYGAGGIAFQLILGVCVASALIAGFRVLSSADKHKGHKD